MRAAVKLIQVYGKIETPPIDTHFIDWKGGWGFRLGMWDAQRINYHRMNLLLVGSVVYPAL